MIDRHIARISLRRGTESQRLQITPLTGEMIYTTDTKRTYVGDGNPGGYLLSNRNFLISATNLPIVSSIPALSGDLVINRKNNSAYVVTGSGAYDYFPISQSISNGTGIFLNIDGEISIDPAIFGDGLNYNSTIGVVSSNVDGNTIYINNSSLSVKIDPSRGLSSDLSGIYVNVDGNSIKFDANSSLSVNVRSGYGLVSDGNGIYADIDNNSIILDSTGKLKVDVSTLLTANSGYIIEAQSGIAYGQTVNGTITARTLSAVLDHNTITLNNSGAISILNLPVNSVGRSQCKTDIISGGADPISFDSLSGLYLDGNKLMSLIGSLTSFSQQTVKFKKFPEIASGQVINHWSCITILCTDGKLRTIGKSNNYGGGVNGWDGSGNMYASPKMRVITRDIDYELDEDDEIIKLRTEWFSTWFLTKKGRMFFWGYSYFGESGITDTSFKTNNVIRKYTEIPLSGAKVVDFKVGCGLGPGWYYDNSSNSLGSPPNTVFAVASLSGVDFFNTHKDLSAYSIGDKTSEFIGISWGYNGYGQAGVNSKTQTIPPTIIYDYTKTSPKPFSVKKICPIGTYIYGCAYLIDKDDQVWATGSNNVRNLGVPALSTTANSIYFQKCYVRPNATYTGGKLANSSQIILLKAEDIVGTNGGNYSKDHAEGAYTIVFAISGGYVYSCGYNICSQAGHNLALNTSPTDSFIPVNKDATTKLSGVQEILTNNSWYSGCSVFAKTSTGLFGWGRNYSGELGLGHRLVQTFATEIKINNQSITNIAKMEPYGFSTDYPETHFILLTTEGDIYMSGNAKLGDGYIRAQYPGTYTLNLTKINRIKNKKWVDFKSSGSSYYNRGIVYAVTEDGELYGWGANLFCSIFFPSIFAIAGGNANDPEDVVCPILIPITD